MKVLVIGSGGREHALVWKIAQSRKVKKIFCAPGNGGIADIARPVDIKADDIERIIEFAKVERIDLTVAGPEAPLVAGIVDEFSKAGLRIFGPVKELAALEGSKIYAKELMKKYGVPTADFRIFDNSIDALKYLDTVSAPLVVKADGLAAGKGVTVCGDVGQAKDAVKKAMDDKVFGEAGSRVLIEECLEGEEASIIAISDGRGAAALASSQDHKRAYDNDQGPNTGGMGAYSPAPVVTDELFKECMDKAIYPMINGLAKDGKCFKGVLYAGIMVTGEGPKVLEFNVRFGDPETQAILPRLKTDIVEIMEASIEGALSGVSIEWDPRPCVSVVMASGGYPGKYEKGKVISGLEDAPGGPDAVVFHAGTRLTEDAGGRKACVTNGGRVLNVTALGSDIKDAIENSYRALARVSFEGMHYRKDIGQKALNRLAEPQTHKGRP
ncbi:phosphoribosylamine--glycine ligase [Candidatus Omnitrophota bacterium]